MNTELLILSMLFTIEPTNFKKCSWYRFLKVWWPGGLLLCSIILKTLLTLNVLCISESYIEIKINLIFYFHASLWCSKCFMEAPQKSVKIKIWLNFFSSSGIRTGRVKRGFNLNHVNKVSTETFAGGWKECIWLRKTFLIISWFY